MLVNKLIIDNVYHHDNENPQGIVHYICLIGIDLKSRGLAGGRRVLLYICLIGIDLK